MAIVKMKKFHLLVLDSYREKLLRELQIFRNIQFEDVCEIEDFEEKDLFKFKRPHIEEKVNSYEEKINQCNYAIDLITKYTPSVSGFKNLVDGLPNYTFEEMEKKAREFPFEEEYGLVKELGDELNSIESGISKRREVIKELEPVQNLDISFNELDKLRHFDACIGGVSGKIVDLFIEKAKELKYSYFEEIGIYKDEHYYLIISDKREEEDLVEVMRVGNFNRLKLNSELLPKDEILKLKNEIEELQKKKSEVIKKLGEKNSKVKDFELVYDYVGNLKVRELAQKEFMTSESVCVLSGYCPEYEVSRLEKMVKENSNNEYMMEFEEVDRDSEEVPIMLKNSRLVSAFEGITSTYALPKYNEVDPTPLYAPIYAFFFGMMSADFGYGVVLFLLTTLALKRCNLSPNMKKNVKFFQLISVFTVICGFLYGSYFGKEIPGMWHLFTLSRDFMTILVISIIIGGFHLFYGLAIKGYMHVRDKRYADMFFDVIVWYMTLLGIIGFILSGSGVLAASFVQPTKYLMILGILLLVVGGARAATGGLPQRLVAGLYNVYGISNYIGDFVSYSRLMALGMSGGYIAFSVNMIAGMVWGHGIIGYVAAIFILVFFHAFNLFLACLGAYVHALRLIYVEFFGKFYEGGGKAFKFFRNKTKYINLDRQYED